MPRSEEERNLLIDIRRSLNPTAASRRSRRPSFPPTLRMPDEDRHYPAETIPTAEIRRAELGDDVVLHATISPREESAIVVARDVKLLPEAKVKRSERKLARRNSQLTDSTHSSRRSLLGRVQLSRQNSSGVGSPS